MKHLMLTIIVASSLLAPAAAVAAEEAAVIYANRCAFCHGASGKGDGPAGTALNPPPTNFANPEYWASADPATVRSIVADGKSGTAMVGFKQMLSPAEIDAVVAHLKTFNNAP